MDTMTRVVRLAEITNADPPERLIELIQNRNGNVPKQEREDAIVVLIKRFEYLITKTVNTLYFQEFRLWQYGYDVADLMQEAMMEFCVLAKDDFKLKTEENDTGLAVFGYYIKSKLYWRMKAFCQRQFKKGLGKEIGVDYDKTLNELSVGRNGMRDQMRVPGGAVEAELREAIIANALSYDDLVLDHITNEQQIKMLDELIEIANTVLDERDRIVWYDYFFSEKKVDEIGEQTISKLGEGEKIGRSRVLQIAKSANDRVLKEFGRRSAVRRVGL